MRCALQCSGKCLFRLLVRVPCRGVPCRDVRSGVSLSVSVRPSVRTLLGASVLTCALVRGSRDLG